MDVLSVLEEVPEAVEIITAWKAAAHSDDCNVLGVHI